MNSEPPNEMKNVSRRDFFKIAIGLISGLITALLAWPFTSYLVRPFFRLQKNKFVEVPGYEGISEGKPAKLNFQMVYKDAFQTSNIWQDVWVIKHTPEKATVFSPICTHLGCRYNWQPRVKEFICPCHGSVFSITGKVLAGPAPRPLDTLPHKIEGEKLYVEWERFKPGIPEKVEI